MNLLTDWVVQIIIFLLIATIIELVVPNNSMKKYVNLILGLLLILIFTKPLVYLFSIDIKTEMNRVEQSILQEGEANIKMDSMIEMQKSEIENEQAAYILNEVKQQLIVQANEPLQEEYAMQIIDIQFNFGNEVAMDDDNLEELIVTVTDQVTDDVKEIIEPITININEKQHSTIPKQFDAMTKTLADIWEIDEQKITITVVEGGTN